MISLKDQNIIVTGASGGIGSSIVEHLYEAGANILVAGSFLFNHDDLITATNTMSDKFNYWEETLSYQFLIKLI